MPILKEGELDIISHSAEMTMRLGMRLGALLSAGDVICLSGDMGAGKTVFSSGIGRGFGSEVPVTSPTFNLVHQHTRTTDKLILYHLDCYRLQGIDDAETIGIDEILDERNAVVLEWAERIESVLPEERIWIELRVLEETRRNLTIEAIGKRYETLVAKFREAAFGF